ncbi:MAG TPA: TVP38/TMEM64 family protein [Bacillota bacterium]|nr:TVP38/TMEM64 family protein [Bacillota bacterium]
MEVNSQQLWQDIQESIYKISKALIHLLEIYEGFGPFIGILLPFIEALLPFLPLVAFIFANVAAFGLVNGFIYSWIGASMGAIVVFMLTRKLSHIKLFALVRRNKQFTQLTQWVDKHGFGPLFILICLPFSPAFLINIVAALSRITLRQFVLAVLFGKSIMVFSFAYIGTTFLSFTERPLRALLFVCFIIALWFIGKSIERLFTKE